MKLRGEPNSLTEPSTRELQVAELVADGKKNADVAVALGLKPGTVKVYMHSLMNKLNLENRTQVALWWKERAK